MCMGAIILARIERVVFGCFDPKGGAAGSLYDVSDDPRLNHRVVLTPRVREAECAALLSGFFSTLRSRKKRERNKGISAGSAAEVQEENQEEGEALQNIAIPE